MRILLLAIAAYLFYSHILGVPSLLRFRGPEIAFGLLSSLLMVGCYAYWNSYAVLLKAHDANKVAIRLFEHVIAPPIALAWPLFFLGTWGLPDYVERLTIRLQGPALGAAILLIIFMADYRGAMRRELLSLDMFGATTYNSNVSRRSKGIWEIHLGALIFALLPFAMFTIKGP